MTTRLNTLDSIEVTWLGTGMDTGMDTGMATRLALAERDSYSFLKAEVEMQAF